MKKNGYYAVFLDDTVLLDRPATCVWMIYSPAYFMLYEGTSSQMVSRCMSCMVDSHADPRLDVYKHIETNVADDHTKPDFFLKVTRVSTFNYLQQ